MAITPILTEWTKHLATDEEKKEFEKTLRNSVYILSRLQGILKERETGFTRAETDYTDSSWAFKQAHYNGRREELRQTLRLFDFLN